MNNPEKYLQLSGFAKNPKKLLQDGWGKDYLIARNGEDDLYVFSDNYLRYRNKKSPVDFDDLRETLPWMAFQDTDALSSEQ